MRKNGEEKNQYLEGTPSQQGEPINNAPGVTGKEETDSVRRTRRGTVQKGTPCHGVNGKW